MTHFKSKTRGLHRNMYQTDPFFRKNEYINQEDIEFISNSIFKNLLHIERQSLLKQLNEAISQTGTIFPDINSRTPGKTDEINLITTMNNHCEKMQKYLLILLTQYGEETWQRA